mmetsp:Transcript_33097/g.77456  ORF Transcript_33097/g.77456 Transcript_33097/m.77456 type:complete len:490 (-) Transcript_33097:74-1543(-)
MALPDEIDLDVLVTQFSRKDQSVLSSLGKDCLEIRWQLQVGFDSDPLEIKVHVDEANPAATAVGIVIARGFQMTQLFPTRRGVEGEAFAFSAPMKQDFVHRWSFRGRIPSLTVPKFYEFMTPDLDQWVPATVMMQHPSGSFEILAFIPDPSGNVLREVGYANVSKEELREATTSRPVELPVRCLELHVPADDPTCAALFLNGKGRITHRFSRPSPPPDISGELAHPRPRLNAMRVHVTKDRQVVCCQEGEAVLRDFLSAEVLRGPMLVAPKRKSWVLQLGPFCWHKVDAELRTPERVVIRIDDTPCIECTGQALGCEAGVFSCEINFVGEKIFMFQVFMVNIDGHPLDDTGAVRYVTKYNCRCKVIVRNLGDPFDAELVVNGVNFEELAQTRANGADEGLEVEPEKFRLDYGVGVPHKVDVDADTDFQAFAKRLIGLGPTETHDSSGLFGLFNIFCCRRPVSTSAEPVQPERKRSSRKARPRTSKFGSL